MPTVKQDESRDDFIERCIPVIIDEGKGPDQAIAICNSIWKEDGTKGERGGDRGGDKKRPIEEMKLEVSDIKDVEIMQFGTWKGNVFGEKEANEIIKNFKDNVVEPYITLDHNPAITTATKKFFNAMSLGFVDKLKLVGDKLIADFKQVPKLIAELINAGSLKKRSVEWWVKGFKHGNGKLYNNVLEAVTYHGANGVPAISTLADIPKFFKECDQDEYKRSIEQGKLVSMTFQNNTKEVDNMPTIEIEKSEYEELLKNKVSIEKFKLDSDAKNSEVELLKAEVTSKTEELTKLQAEKEDLVKMKADIEKAKKESLKKEADDYVQSIVDSQKLLPKFKEMKADEYIRLKADDSEDGLKLFKEELESRDKVVNFQEVTKNLKKDEKKEEFKAPEYATEAEVQENAVADMDNVDESIKKQMKLKGYMGENGYAKAGYELGIISKTELPESVRQEVSA